MISSPLYDIIPFYDGGSKFPVIEIVNSQGEEIGLASAYSNSLL